MSETTIVFEGEALPARIGESVASALAASGRLALRHTASGGARGMFCGMGVCQDCLVTVDGVPNRRACMTKIAGPLKVERAGARAPLAERAPLLPVTLPDVPVREAEIVVVGAGPAGLSAAIAARQAGAEVLLLDERPLPGGQYYKQLAVGEGQPPDRQHRDGAALIEAARAAGVELVSDAAVWGAFEPLELAVTIGGGTCRVLPQRLVLATGAYERARPVPGWTLPGVMTTGAAQTLWRTARRVPGRRVLIAGNGPLNLQLAGELLEGGAEIVALAEASAGPGPRGVLQLGAMALAAPGLFAEGIRYAARLLRRRVPVLNRTVVERIEPGDGALLATLRRADGAVRKVATDIVCLGYGFEPSSELLRVLGAAHEFDGRRGYLVPRRSAEGETSLAGVYAVGDCTGIGGAKVALAEGTLIGAAAARSLGHRVDPLEPAMAARERGRQRRFQRALWTLYDAPRPTLAEVAPEAVVCRCEEVTAGAVAAALAEGCSSIGEVKRLTRAGMGRCQGRYCGTLLNEAVALGQGGAADEFSGFAPRLPVKPLDIESLARPGVLP
jgi:NADPH-dependent 2,4-dienoyl-CoA reductase/sulfur reductase-like enzyme